MTGTRVIRDEPRGWVVRAKGWRCRNMMPASLFTIRGMKHTWATPPKGTYTVKLPKPARCSTPTTVT